METKSLVWDLPTRVCHWLFALSLSACLAIALLFDDEDPLFRYHMLLGLVTVGVVVVRILLGMLGSPTARFSAFPLQPARVAAYFRSVLSRERVAEFAGNNPGSALAATAMFILVPALVVTGLNANVEWAEELHEPLAYALLIVICLHLLGLFIHTLVKGEAISFAMVHGRKVAPQAQALVSSRPWLGLLVLLMLGAWGGSLWQGFDALAGTVRVPVLGTTIQLGEPKEGEKEYHHRGRSRKGGGDRDDD